MATRPDAINLTNTNNPPQEDEDLEAYAQRMIQVLDRGFMIDRFKVSDCPDNIHYEWHKDDPGTHARLTAKGFVPNDELAKKSDFVHTDGAGNPRIADVRLYTISKAKYEILQKIENEHTKRAQDPRRQDEDFLESLKSEIGSLDYKESGSSAERISGTQLQARLNTPDKGE